MIGSPAGSAFGQDIQQRPPDARPGEIQSLVNTAIDQESDDRKQETLLEAYGIARAWADAEPDNPEAQYWLAVTLGMRAEISGPRSKIRLGREAFEVAKRGVELDSLHAGALHVLGRVYAGARGLNWFTRVIAGQLGLGEVLDEASWERAEQLMVRATELEPDNPVFRYELGAFYYGRDRADQAIEHLSRVRASPGFETLPSSAQRRACRMIAELQPAESCTGS